VVVVACDWEVDFVFGWCGADECGQEEEKKEAEEL
jgi:hypothetical protein